MQFFFYLQLYFTSDIQAFSEVNYIKACLDLMEKLFFSFQVNATDPDCGVNGHIRYFMAEQALPTIDMFRVDINTGQICVAKELDFELQEVYDFPVVAKDNGELEVAQNETLEAVTKLIAF